MTYKWKAQGDSRPRPAHVQMAGAVDVSEEAFLKLMKQHWGVYAPGPERCIVRFIEEGSNVEPKN